MSSPHPVLGHRPVLDALELDLKTGNIAHAYLFAGCRHLGKFTVARWFAEELLTVDIEDAVAKDKARLQVQKLLHPDILVLDKLWMEEVSDDPEDLGKFTNIPQEHRKKAKAKTDTISIDDVRLLQERLQDVRTGRFRCCVIRSVERMHDEAVNALLKVLEEPLPGVVFILTTQALSSLLPTLISRTRVLRFSRLGDRDLTGLLTGLSQEDTRFLLRLAQGAPGVIKRLRQDPDAVRLERQAFDHAVSFWQSRSLQERLRLLTPLHEKNPEADQFLVHLSLALRDDVRAQPLRAVDSLHQLVLGFKTNTSRQLLVQRFALAVGE